MVDTKTKSIKKRRVHSAEFKAKALRLVAQGGSDAKTIAKNLGISPSLIYKWGADAREAEAKAPKAKSTNGPTRVSQRRAPVVSEVELSELRRLNAQYKSDITALRHTIGLLSRES